MDRAPRHHAMVDFQQHQERKWCVLEEDHEKVEKRAKQLEELLRECVNCVRNGEDFDLPVTTMQRIDAVLGDQQRADSTSAKSALVASPAETGSRVVAHRLINELGEVMTDWHDGEPPENLTDLCGVAMAGVRAELAYAGQPARQVGGDQPKLAVWYGAMPESNGKSNFTAVLMREGESLFDGLAGGITIDRSEYPDRVRYEADRVRYLIGELKEEPFILDYDADKHSGYVAPSEAVEAGYTPVKTEAVLFLLGLGTEPFTQPEGKGKFWWRQRLHEAIPGGLEAMLAEDKRRHSPS